MPIACLGPLEPLFDAPAGGVVGFLVFAFLLLRDREEQSGCELQVQRLGGEGVFRGMLIDGNVESKFTKDEMLTNVMVYWVTGTPTSAARLYYELRHPLPGSTRPAGRVEVPTGCAAFPKEISYTPRAWLEAAFNLTHHTVMPRGGHFAALEEPELLTEDIRTFFRTVR